MRLGRVTKLRLAPHFEWYKKVIQKAMTLVFFFFFLPVVQLRAIEYGVGARPAFPPPERALSSLNTKPGNG